MMFDVDVDVDEVGCLLLYVRSVGWVRIWEDRLMDGWMDGWVGGVSLDMCLPDLPDLPRVWIWKA